MMKPRLFDIGQVIRRFSSKDPRKLSKGQHIDKLIENYSEKILFSSYVESRTMKLGFRKNRALELKLDAMKNKEKDNIRPFPISLKYLNPDLSIDNEQPDDDQNEKLKTENVYLPYANISNNLLKEKTSINSENESDIDDTREKKDEYKIFEKIDHNWMTDYKTYAHDLEEEGADDIKNYGTPDANYTRVGPPCGGCGALLNCVSTGMPGYLPSELYKRKSEDDLKGVTCQRCHFLKNYNIALNLTVEPDYYNTLLSSLKDKFGLIVLLVDLLDFPGCIWPGLSDLIGKNRPIFIVGNKVDLIPKDSSGYLRRIEDCLKEAVIKIGFDEKYIKHITLVSATTGYGIENLITTLHQKWGTKGDVYIIGCTNVGKSTIFNALLGSDFCKFQATDLIQRATASPWPGTTLNMLRFPILRPSGMRMYIRNERLKKESQELKAEKELRKLQMTQGRVKNPVTLIGHIGQTFRVNLANEESKDMFSVRQSCNARETTGINERNREFRETKWCYDTPGVMHDNQILDLLTTDEILMTLPKKTIRIRNYCIQPNYSVLLAGLGRLDYVEGNAPIRLSVYASESLPVLICRTEDVDEIYKCFLGTPVLGIPHGSDKRLEHWPGLKASDEVINVVGESGEKAVADFLLSSAGWISVTPFPDQKASFRHYTLAGRGAIVRMPSLILYGASVRGARIRKSPAYKVVDHHSKKYGNLM